MATGGPKTLYSSPNFSASPKGCARRDCMSDHCVLVNALNSERACGLDGGHRNRRYNTVCCQWAVLIEPARAVTRVARYLIISEESATLMQPIKHQRCYRDGRRVYRLCPPEGIGIFHNPAGVRN